MTENENGTTKGIEKVKEKVKENGAATMKDIYEAFNSDFTEFFKEASIDFDLKHPIDSEEAKDEVFKKLNSLVSDKNKWIKN